MKRILDPENEYYRSCPYCGTKFMADHMLQIYCPEKYGKKNYCKNRQKRRIQNQFAKIDIEELES